jgi:hypothetical protein
VGGQVSQWRSAGLADRSQRPWSCPNQTSAQVEARVCELRRAHPKWGAQRIVHELMRSPRRRPTGNSALWLIANHMIHDLKTRLRQTPHH